MTKEQKNKKRIQKKIEIVIWLKKKKKEEKNMEEIDIAWC